MQPLLYDEQTVEDETLSLCGELSGEGVANEEIAYGLWPAMSGFAPLMRDSGLRQGMAELLEGLAHELRTQPPMTTNAQLQSLRQARRRIALVRLQHLAEQDRRL
jgi:hypothetical protein